MPLGLCPRGSTRTAHIHPARERERERLQRAAVGLRAKEDLGVRYEFGSRVLGCMVSGDFHTCCPARALPTLLHLMWDKKV